MPNAIRIIMLIAPWFSVPCYPRTSFKKFLPVSLLASSLVVVMCTLAFPYKWWLSKGNWFTKILNDGSFIVGPFFVGTLWIFHFTFGNFKRYFLTNVLMDLFFAFPLTYAFQKLKLFKLLNFKPVYIFSSFLSFSMIIYCFQMIYQKIK